MDRQLFGRCARQGDPGSARAYLSPDDEILRWFLPDPPRYALHAALVAHLPGADRLVSVATDRAQSRAQSLAFRQRRQQGFLTCRSCILSTRPVTASSRSGSRKESDTFEIKERKIALVHFELSGETENFTYIEEQVP